MSVPILIRKDSFQRALWKNGLGHTDQIGIEPTDARLQQGNYLWRVSSARITSASDFSIFPDHDRGLVILEGAGVRLTHRDEESDFVDTVDLPPLEPYEFPGDIRSRCELIDGPVQDLSVFFRKGDVVATMDVVNFDSEEPWQWEPDAKWNLLFAARGNFEVAVSETAMISVTEGDAVRFDRDGNQENLFPVVPHFAGAALIHIKIWNG